MFDVSITNGPSIRESASSQPGQTITPSFDTPLGTIGLAICYDLRFPEVALTLRRQGAQILTYPSAFTLKTGAAHWELLLRSTAMMSQCYVVAAAQVGKHNEKRESYGHAMVLSEKVVWWSNCRWLIRGGQ
jgi:predicted amidohydrolase